MKNIKLLDYQISKSNYFNKDLEYLIFKHLIGTRHWHTYFYLLDLLHKSKTFVVDFLYKYVYWKKLKDITIFTAKCFQVIQSWHTKMAREASAAVVFLFLMPLLVNFKQICTLDAVREFYRRIAQPLVMLQDTFESLITKLLIKSFH